MSIDFSNRSVGSEMMRFSAWMRLIVYQIGSNPNNSGRKHDQTGNFLSKKRSKSRISAYQLNGYRFYTHFVLRNLQ